VITGVVASFDAARGDGTVTLDNGETLSFHCVGIADGTRTIGVGATVTAERVVGHCGRDEATALSVRA
jgi:cold shock CspA family protein